MSESFFHEIKRYVGFGAEDHRLLRAFHPLAAPHFRAIAEQFYDQIRDHVDARTVFQSEAQVERLRVSLCGWMHRVMTGPWDQAYREAGDRIGRMHVKVKLPQRYMFTAMARIRVALLALVHASVPAADVEATAAAICRVLDLELAIMLETFREDYIAAVRRFEQLERDMLQRRLEVSEARYQALIEDAGIVIVGVDSDHLVRLFNRGAETATGYTRADILGHDCRDVLCHPGDEAALSAIIQATLSGEPVSTVETRILDRRATEHWIRWHPTRFAISGQVEVACLIGMDVTDGRVLAEQTRRSEHLASLGTMAAGLAHEIRNPLNAAQLQLMLAERRLGRASRAPDGDRGGDPDDVAQGLEAMARVRSELERLGGLVGDFLAFARPSQLRLRGIDVGDLVRDTVTLLGPAAHEAGVSLTVSITHALVARVDRERITQVLHNLLKNAIEAASVSVEAAAVTVVGQRTPTVVIIEIIDTGAGPPDNIDIFEPFATSKEGGTGLGLPIVHRIVHDHGGSVTVARRDAVTVFTVELPLDGP